VIASGLWSNRSVTLSADNGNFETTSELLQCMKASMSLPGITGDFVRLNSSQVQTSKHFENFEQRGCVYTSLNQIDNNNNNNDDNNINGSSSMSVVSEPLTDALVYEPIPYRSAIRDNCTHVLVLRTRADNTTVTAKMSLAERLIMKRYFGRKQKMPHHLDWMINQYHKLIYAEDILILNDANRNYGSACSMKDEHSYKIHDRNKSKLYW
jgi:predicted patatin/cPLA2 family phospholipase